MFFYIFHSLSHLFNSTQHLNQLLTTAHTWPGHYSEQAESHPLPSLPNVSDTKVTSLLVSMVLTALPWLVETLRVTTQTLLHLLWATIYLPKFKIIRFHFNASAIGCAETTPLAEMVRRSNNCCGTKLQVAAAIAKGFVRITYVVSARQATTGTTVYAKCAARYISN